MLAKASDNVPVTFVNTVVGRGTLNGVVNLTLGTFNFTPDDTDNKIDPDLVISARLRMDVTCARNLHKALGDLLESIDNHIPAAEPTPVPTTDGIASGKPN